MSHRLKALPSLLLVTLAACGGGGSGTSTIPAGTNVAFTATPAAQQQIAAGQVITLSATLNSYKGLLANMSWTATAMDPAAPALQLTNANCSSVNKRDTTSGGLSSSIWTCSAATVGPQVTKATTYSVTVSGTDAGGNATSYQTQIIVAASASTGGGSGGTSNPGSTLVANTTAVNLTGTSGASLQVGCSGAGGTLATGSNYTYNWVIASNPSGANLNVSSPSAASQVLTLPAVSSPTSITLQCRVTDSSATTATQSVGITITPPSGGTLPTYTPVANAGAAQVVTPGNVVMLDASGSSVVASSGSSTGIANSYQWRQIGGPAVTLSSATSAKASFVAPAVTSPTDFDFEVTVDTLPASGAPSASRTRVTVYPQGNLRLQISPPATVRPGGTGTITVTAANVPAGTPLFLVWSQVNGPALQLQAVNSPVLGYVVPTTVSGPAIARLQVCASYDPDMTAPLCMDALVNIQP